MTDKTPCPAALDIAGAAYHCDNTAPHDGWPHTSREAEAMWVSDLDPVPGMPGWETYERDVLVPIREGRA